jgi:hypothetical protein
VTTCPAIKKLERRKMAKKSKRGEGGIWYVYGRHLPKLDNEGEEVVDKNGNLVMGRYDEEVKEACNFLSGHVEGFVGYAIVSGFALAFQRADKKTRRFLMESIATACEGEIRELPKFEF